ncbi:hypothetical protein [Streptomyces rishiriensis]|uniref:Secreted protein n=1 Tax=Streptomyces rishiriensis TaxID=68264 RepID=A0ABU0NT32_STRRH|nr:hypothetical protein [Streptomyces rishiriensis]MDQ0581888.1 hypothetical protein [Streptomyces rishiriensis]
MSENPENNSRNNPESPENNPASPVSPVSPATSEKPETGLGSPEVVEGVGADAEPAVVKPARKVRRPGRIAAVAGSALLACAVVGGVGYTVVTVQDADRDAGKPTWKYAPPVARDDEKTKRDGAAESGLSALLLPYGTDGYERGPDLAEFGPDAEFSGAQATALRKESIKDLPGTSRRQLEKLIDKQHIEGVAMRSYVVGRLDYNITDAITVEVNLSRMENRTAVREAATSFNGFLAATDVLRKGPKIAGNKDAQCFLTPKAKDKDKELGVALCTAYVGDVLVSVTADAPGTLDAKFVAKFFTAQLDRIDDPGQAV